MAEPAAMLCPYCGEVLSGPAEPCGTCGGFLDERSRRVTQQQMGPWFIRDSHAPHRPGCSYAVLRALVERGKVKRGTIVRGPTTRQFWSVAGRAPGVAHLLGLCHACGAETDAGADRCDRCEAVFPRPTDRQRLGLDRDDPEVLKRAAAPPAVARPGGAAASEAALAAAGATAPPPASPPAHPPAYADQGAAGDRPDTGPAEPAGSTSLLVWVLVALNVLLILAVATAIALHMLGE